MQADARVILRQRAGDERHAEVGGHLQHRLGEGLRVVDDHSHRSHDVRGADGLVAR